MSDKQELLNAIKQSVLLSSIQKYEVQSMIKTIKIYPTYIMLYKQVKIYMEKIWKYDSQNVSGGYLRMS